VSGRFKSKNARTQVFPSATGRCARTTVWRCA